MPTAHIDALRIAHRRGIASATARSPPPGGAPEASQRRVGSRGPRLTSGTTKGIAITISATIGPLIKPSRFDSDSPTTAVRTKPTAMNVSMIPAAFATIPARASRLPIRAVSSSADSAAALAVALGSIAMARPDNHRPRPLATPMAATRPRAPGPEAPPRRQRSG